MSLISQDDVVDVKKINSINQISDKLWMETRDKNVSDYDVIGFVVFRAYIWMFTKWLSATTFLLIEKVFFSKGLIRKMCQHNGTFFMVGKRQTCMASGSMAKPANEGTESDYWNKRTMSTTLLPLIMSMINRLGEEALQHQNSSGDLVLNLLRITLELADVSLHTFEICIYNIVTYNFFNTRHRDKDGLSKKNNDDIVQYIKASKLPQLMKWLQNFYRVFGAKTNLSMPTTCCWTLVEYCLLWIHVQYFVILDVLLGYDVSSDIMNDIGEGEGTIGQAGATFYGALLDHLTAAPIWISIDGAFVTIVCPGKCYNGAWGRGGVTLLPPRLENLLNELQQGEGLLRKQRIW